MSLSEIDSTTCVFSGFDYFGSPLPHPSIFTCGKVKGEDEGVVDERRRVVFSRGHQRRRFRCLRVASLRQILGYLLGRSWKNPTAFGMKNDTQIDLTAAANLCTI